MNSFFSILTQVNKHWHILKKQMNYSLAHNTLINMSFFCFVFFNNDHVNSKATKIIACKVYLVFSL